MERPLVTAVTHSDDEARVTLTGVRDEPGVAGRIFGALADANVNVDMIIQNEPVSADDSRPTSRSRSSRDDLRDRDRGARRARDSASGIETDERIGKVSIVGAGMRSHPGVAAKVFRDARRERDQHRDDLHLADQDLLRDRRRPGAGRRSRRCTRRSSWARTRSAARSRPATEHRPTRPPRRRDEPR